jgi:hypothetical protein
MKIMLMPSSWAAVDPADTTKSKNFAAKLLHAPFPVLDQLGLFQTPALLLVRVFQVTSRQE